MSFAALVMLSFGVAVMWKSHLFLAAGARARRRCYIAPELAEAPEGRARMSGFDQIVPV